VSPGARFDFTGQSVLVTGASRGIGRGVAEAFAASGADLSIIADDAGIETAAGELSAKHGREVIALRCDISDRAAVRRALDRIVRIDILVNNAGLERITPIAEPGVEVEVTFERIITINILGTYFVTRDALPKMLNGGRIIFTSSIWGRTAAAEFSAYCASKHALIGLARSLALELGPKGITVNAVAPGWVRTDQSMLSLKKMAERSGLSEKQLMMEILDGQSLPGLMEPADIASLYLFLASKAAANITGQTVNIDRGEVMS
jgi:NAD(P)-dependent dehydrogenase (short-subunit alcohol dehydrogenase family)